MARDVSSPYAGGATTSRGLWLALWLARQDVLEPGGDDPGVEEIEQRRAGVIADIARRKENLAGKLHLHYGADMLLCLRMFGLAPS